MSSMRERVRRLNRERGRAGWGERPAAQPLGVAVEVPLAGESVLTGKDGQGDELALGEGCFGAGVLVWRIELAEVVDQSVGCG